MCCDVRWCCCCQAGGLLLLPLHLPRLHQGAKEVRLVETTALFSSPGDGRSVSGLLLGCGLCHTAAAAAALLHCQLCSQLISNQEGCVVCLLEGRALCVQHLLVAGGVGCHARVLQQLLHSRHVCLRTDVSQWQRAW